MVMQTCKLLLITSVFHLEPSSPLLHLRSMVPDVVDMAHLKTGVRREELFYAFFVFGNKFASGVTLGISTGIYE